MTTNERMYLRMLMLRDPRSFEEIASWIHDRRTKSTDIYIQWLRDGQFDWIQDDNNRILELRTRERRCQE